MTAKTYSLIMGLATMIAWVGFFIIIFNFDPQEANWVIFVLFYFTVFLAVLGTMSLLGFWIRMWLARKRNLLRTVVRESFRQAFIVSIVVVLALVLQAVRILTWWNISLLVIAAATVEFLILLFKHNQPDNFEA